MAKRMLSLLLAAVMILGMLPAMNLSVSAQESAQTALTPLWSANFDDQTKVYNAANDGTVTNSVWSTYKTSVYNFSFPEKTSDDKYMTIVSGETGESKPTFELASTAFTPTDKVFVTMDLMRPVSGKDGIKVLIHDEDGKALGSLIIDWQNKIQYDLKGGTTWADSGISAPYGSEWFNLSIAALQSETEGEDQLIITCGGKTATVKGTFASDKGATRLLLQAQGSGYNKEAHSQARNLDNIAVYAYVPATGIAFANNEYTLQPGGKVQTAVVVTPTLTMPAVKAVYTSGNDSIATVDANGRITGVAAGTTTITATLTNHDGSVKTAETTVKVEGAKILWDSDFDSESLTPADANFNMSTNVSNGKWYSTNVNRNTNGGYSVKLVADTQDPSNHYLSIKPGAATDAVVTAYNYLSTAFAETAAIDVRFKLWLHEDENGYRDNLSFRLHPAEATQGGLMDVAFTSDGTVWAANSTINTNGYEISKEDAAAGLNVRIVAVQNEGADSDAYKVYINGTLVLAGTTLGASVGAPHVNYSFQMISLKTGAAAAGKYTNIDTRIDDLVVYEYVPALATGVTLDAEALTLKAGQTAQLAAAVAPADAEDYTLSYASNKESVATVSQTGLITAVAEGTATITVTLTNSNGTTCTDTVTVTVPKVDPNLLWSEDFEDNAADEAYAWDELTVPTKHAVVVNKGDTNSDYYYNCYVRNVDGDNCLHITHDNAAMAEGGQVACYGFNTFSAELGNLSAAVVNFKVKFGASDVLHFRLCGGSNNGILLGLYFYKGTVRYGYTGGTWSDTKEQAGSFISANPSVTLSPDVWHDLQLVAFQRSGEETDYWALLKDGQILLEHQPGETFGGNSFNTNGINKFMFYVQSASSGTVQINNTYLDDLAVYQYVPATGVALDQDSYALTDATTVQAAATVTPDLVLPNVQVEYSIADTAIATVDANGVITGVSGGTTTLTAKVTNYDGSVITDTATVKVTHVETVLWDAEFDNWPVTPEGQFWNYSTNLHSVGAQQKWRWDEARNTNGDYNIQLVADAQDPSNHYLQIKAGAATTETTKAFRYRTSNFAASPAMEISFKLWLNKDANNRWDSFSLQVHPYNVTDAYMLGIHFGNDGCVTYPTADGTGKTAQLKANQWQDVRLVVIQNADDAFDTFKLYVDDVLMAQWIGCTYSSDYRTGNPHAFQLITSAGSNGLYTCVDTRIDDLVVRSYTPVEAESLDVQESAVTVGRTPVQLHATVMPANADTYKITYTSANTGIATVSETGLITGVAGGQTTVTVTVTNADGSSFSKTVAVTVDGENLNLLWSADFDDTDYVYDVPNGDTVTNSVWASMSPSVYTVTYPEASANNRYMQIAGNQAGSDGQAATYAFQSTIFASTDIISLTMDLYRPLADKDGMRIRLLDNAGKAIATILVTHDGKIQYAFGQGGGSAWKDTFLTVPSGRWHTLKIVVLQSQQDGEDQLSITSGDSTETFVGTFTNTTAGVAQICFMAPADGYNMAKYSECIGIDNLQACRYTPTPAMELIVPATMEAEEGRGLQLPVTVTPAEADLYRLSYVSADETVATVDASGKILGVKVGGSTTITVTLTNTNGTTITKTVAVTVIEANALIWEEDFDDKEIGSTGGFKVVNTNTALGSITVQDATGFGGTDNALVMDRDYGALFTLNGGFELPATDTKMVLEYRVLNADTTHQNTVLPTLAGAHNNSKRFLSLFINNGMLYWNNGEAYSVQALDNQTWYTIKLVIDTDKGEFQLYLDGQLVASEQQLLYGNTGPITHVYFQSSTSDDQAMGDGLWMDDFKVYVYTPIEDLELLDDSVTLEGQSSTQIRVQVTPEDANGQIIWTSSNESIAIVDGNGVVTGVTPGEVTITAATFEGDSDTVQVIVREVKPTSIVVDQTELNLPAGAHTYINAVALPTHATPNTVAMASSDASVVTVDEWGEVVCLKAGTAELIFTSGEIVVKVPVTVTEAGVMETIHISPNGTTIAQALARIAEVNATQTKMTGNIEVIVADGYYYFADTLQMNELHGGTNGYTVIWKAAAGAKPTFGGALRIAGSNFTADANGIYSINLATLGVPKVADPDTMSTTRQLFVDNVRATRARSEGGLTACEYYKPTGTNLGHVSDIMLEGLAFTDFARPKDLEFVYQELWTQPRAGVDSILDNGDGTVSIIMDQPGWRYATNKGASSAGADGPVWIENALELLDQPGEWYLNEETQILYYMPRAWEDMNSVTVTLPLLDAWDQDENGVSGLIHIAGTDYDNMVHNISFQGITFADTTWTRPSSTNGHSDAQNNHLRETGDVMTEGSITITKANGICFTECTFTRLGITAVKLMKGVQNSFFVGNHFYDLSAGAINIGEPYLADKDVSNPSDRRKMMKNCDVLNNYIHNVAVDFNSSAAISLSWGPDMDFSYNEMFNMAYSGYHIGYGWTTKFENNLKNLVVSNNFIHDFMGDGVADGGGVYTIGNSGGDENNYNQVSYNYVKTVLDDSGPLYMDNGATFYEVHHNVVDLSRVTDWRGNKSISWLQMNTGASNLKVHDNYATVKKYNNYAAKSEVEDGHLETAGAWSAEALAIINGAGLQSPYAEKYKQLKHAELIVLNLEDGADMEIGEIRNVQVSYTDGKDVAITGVNYVKHMESLTPNVVTLAADGTLEAVGKGEGRIRIWIVSNDILEVVERTVYVSDDISEIYLTNYRGKDTLTMSNQSTGIMLNTSALMEAGRILAVDAQYLTFTVGDEAIAKVVDGVLLPVSNGSTKLTVKVDMNGMTAEVIYQVNIVNVASFEVSYMEEMFASEKSEWSNVSGTWIQENDSSLTVKTSGWITYRSNTYENELLTFKLRLDTTTTSGWPCVYIRADSADVGSAGGGASGYVIVFGNATKGLEVQRWNGSTRTMIAGDLVGFPPLSGKTHVEHGLNDGQEHLVQIGALTDGGTTYLVVYVDGRMVFEYLDDSADALTAPGYFGIVGRNEIFYLNKASAEDLNKKASIGDQIYESIQAALAAAQDGDTVKLLADASADGVVIKEGVALDLNGYNLTTEYLVAFDGGQVVDELGGGVLKCKNVSLAKDNSQMPVWDETSQGYRFFDMADHQKYWSQAENSFTFVAKPALGNLTNDKYLAAAETNGLKVKTRIRWQSASGNDVDQMFTFKAEDVVQTYENDDKVLQLKVTGTAAYANELWTTMWIESETGVIWQGAELLYTGTNP